MNQMANSREEVAAGLSIVLLLSRFCFGEVRVGVLLPL